MGRASPDLRPDPARADTPRGCGLPEETAALLEAAGFGVAGRLPIGDYDARVPAPWRSDALWPAARSAYVLGTAGGRFESRWLATAGAGPASDPADTYAREVLREVTAALERETGARAGAWLYCDRAATRSGEPVFADFVRLASACGLGTRSPLGLLLHPLYGPWWSVRALMLTSFAAPAWVAGDPSRAAMPCVDCAAPCVAACPGAAVLATGFDAGACSATRLAGGPCARDCAARRACFVGPEHRYAPRAEAHYAATSLAWLRDSAPPLAEDARSEESGLSPRVGAHRGE